MMMKKAFATALLLAATVIVPAGPSAFAQPDAKKIQVTTSAKTDGDTQTYKGFVTEFQKAASNRLTEDRLNNVFENYSALIMPEVDSTKLMNELEGQETSYFPLRKLQTEPFYKSTIKKLIESANVYDRILAYVTLGSAGDNSFNDSLLKATKTEKLQGARMWSGLALLYLEDKRTSELFDFLVANEDLGDAHMLPFYLKLDKSSLRKTAFEKIKSGNSKARILAVQSLSVTGLTPETDKVVRDAVRTWSPTVKGYAIYTIKELRMGNLKTLLVPYLSNKDLKAISLEALANSSSPEDQNYVLSVANSSSPVSEDILDALLESSDIRMVKAWLSLVRDKKLASKYVFFVFKHPLLSSDDLLTEVQNTIRNTVNPEIRHELPRALAGRNDDESVNLLIQLLSDSDSTTRYWAAASLKGNSSAQLVALLPALIRNPKLRTVALTDLAVQNKIDGLQDVYEPFLKPDSTAPLEWKRSASDYLSAFPQAKDREYFRSILESKQDSFAKRSAALGLGQLKDGSSVDLIIAAMKEEPPHDFNAMPYLVALSKIKGDKAKEVVSSYSASKSEPVRKLVSELLRDW